MGTLTKHLSHLTTAASTDTGAMGPHDPQNWNRYSLPFDYGLNAAPPNNLWFLKDRLEHDEVIALFRSFGTSIARHEVLPGVDRLR